MEKILRLNLAILFLLFAMMLVSPSAASLKNPAGSITVEAKSKKKPAKKSTTRKPVTRTNYITMKKKEKLWVGPSVAAMHPETKDWKSSNAGVLLDTLQFALPSIAFGLTVTLYYSLSRAFGHGFGYTVGIMFLPFIFVLLLGVGRSRYTRPDKYRDKF